MQYINQINTKYYNFSVFFQIYSLKLSCQRGEVYQNKSQKSKNILMQQQSLIMNIGPRNIDFNTICDKNDHAN